MRIKNLIHSFLLSVLILLFYINGYSQWILQASNTSAHFLNIRFLNKNTGWVSGTNGTIVKTTNGGLNWVVQITNLASKEIRGLTIVDSNIVYAAGLFDTFLKTTNGGTNWQILRNGPVPTLHSYWSTYFINPNTGWICGTLQTIYKTTNGGLTLDSINVPAGFMYDIYFRNELEGLACGETAAMFRTTDGGFSWYTINVPVANQSADFDKFSFINNNTGFVIGVQNSKLYKTTNFGITWDSVARIYGMDESYALCFLDENTGFSCGSYNMLYKTTNGGYNWRQENTSQFGSTYLHGIHFYNHDTGWVVGAVGRILYTETGGSPVLSVVSNISNATGFSLGQNYPNPFNPTTKIRFDVANGFPIGAFGNDKVVLKVYDIMGREVQTLVNESLKPGTYEVSFDGSSLNSGVYFYKLITKGFTETKKMLLIK
ncbi:MAG: YCF48-related protein [Ignavibacteriae bacterium]|nr:YCF48-related protein [Ignavibacteriota bacterium]